jgi:hypothetical protein
MTRAGRALYGRRRSANYAAVTVGADDGMQSGQRAASIHRTDEGNGLRVLSLARETSGYGEQHGVER